MARTIAFVVALAGVAAGASAQLSVVVNSNSTSIVQITSVSGTGSQANPLVINENWFGADLEATINLRGALAEANAGVNTNPGNSGFNWGIYVSKRVTNNSGVAWDFFDNELQQVIGVPSGEGDGLSFGQGFAGFRPFTSNIFTTFDEETFNRDYVNFRGGTVLPGQTVVMNFVITDNSPEEIFYLRQRPNFIPTPGAAAVLALGGLVASRRRRA
jgi:hypothetical protein